MTHLAVPVGFVLFALLVVVVPLLRLYLTTGIVGLVPHRPSDPRHLVLGGLFLALMSAAGLYGALLGWVDPARLGVASVPGWLSGLGLAGMGVGTGYVMVAQAQMGSSWRIGIDDRPTALVASGLYRFTRHPIYTGLLFWLWSAVLVAPSVPFAAIAAAVVVVVALQARAEEAHLVQVHGDLYRDYCARVGRFFPRLR